MRAAKRHTAFRRRQIGEAILAMMARDGIAGLSTARLARRVGLVPSALYRHYKNKDEMLDAAIDLIGERLLAQASRTRAATGDPIRQLELLLAAHARHMPENQAIPQLLFSEELSLGPVSRRRRTHQKLRRYIGEIEQIIRAALVQGRTRPAADARTMSIMFMGLVQSAGIYWRLSGRRFDVARYLRQAWRLFRGLLV